jgi:CysZ protein
MEAAAAPFRAIRTVRSSRALWGYFVFPVLLTLAVLTGLVYFSYSNMYPWLMDLLPAGDAWYLGLLRSVLSPLLLVLFILAGAFLYSITGTILTAPFNDPLSAKVEEMLRGTASDEKLTVGAVIGDITRTIKNTLWLMMVLAAVNVLSMLLNLVPVVGGAAYTAIGFSSALFFFGFGFLDFPLERRRLSFREKLRVTWRYRALTMGLGLGFIIITLVPLVGFLGLNLCTVGATELYLRHIDITKTK